jgi:hypothetical protein
MSRATPVITCSEGGGRRPYNHECGTQSTIFGFLPISLANSSIFPYFMQDAIQCFTQAGSSPFLVRGAHKIHSSVGNGR